MWTNENAECVLAGTEQLKVFTTTEFMYMSMFLLNLQLAVTSCHRLQLKAFDCVAAYLHAKLKDSLYVFAPKGLMQEIGQDSNQIWKLNQQRRSTDNAQSATDSGLQNSSPRC